LSLVPPDDREVFYLSQPEGTPVERLPFWRRHRVLLALAGILFVAAFFRFYGRDFDQGTHQHPDERFIVMRTTALSWPGTPEELLDPRTSPLNLRSTRVEGNCPPIGCRYPYGSLPVYLTRGVSWLVDTLLPPTATTPKGYYLGYDGTTVVGRHLSSIFDLITILLVFLIARRLYSSGTALIASALVAFAVTHIQLSHFYASDTFLVTFMMGALYFSVVLMQRPSWWAAAGAGACLGLAIASKVSIAPFALVVVAAVVLRAAYRKQTRVVGAEFGDPVGLQPAGRNERGLSFAGHLVRKGLPYMLVAMVCALLAFAITEPYVLWSFDWSQLRQGGLEAVFDSNPWWRGIQEEAEIQSGRADGAPYTRQYVGTVPVLYHFQNLVLWGLSPLPGLIVLAGMLVGLWHAFRRRPAEVLLMAGALPYFATILTLEAKWMRYMLPLVPILCILGAAMVVRGTLWSRQRYQPYRLQAPAGHPMHPTPAVHMLRRNLFPILGVLAIGGAFLWAVAFMNIYSQKHSRVQATEWILQNVPEGAVRSSEGWDDALPLWGGERYGHVAFNLYDDRPPEQEFEYIKDLLRQTDYIFLASNRLYGSIPKLPWRYPVQTKFYELLFAGKLGFEKAYTAHVTPELFGMRFDDQSADESFTVYDHPRVDIFRKVSNLSDDQLRTMFSTALNRPPGEYSATRHGKVSDDKSLMVGEIIDGQKVSDLPALNDYAWNPLAQESYQWVAVLLWLVAAYILGLLALPIVFTVARNLPDRGYPFAKLAGLLMVGWGVWMSASARLLPFSVWSILFFMLMTGGVSYLCWRLGAREQIRQFFADKLRLVVFYEVVFLLAFGAFLLIRLLNPDLWHPYNGGEKPMEFGFLNAILRSAWMPPLDPFFSGGYINYYYYGQFLIAVLIKLIGVDPAIGFNLAIPLLYAFTFSGAASIAYNLVAWSQRRRGNSKPVPGTALGYGLLSGVLMLVIGNIHGFWQLLMIVLPGLRGPMIEMAKALTGCPNPGQGCIQGAFIAQYTSFNYWDSSRLIVNTINEFPFWSFLFADLHPHLIDMPIILMAAALAINLAFAPAFIMLTRGGKPVPLPASWREQVRDRVAAALQWLWGPDWCGALSFGLMALVLGATAVTNSWDFPTFMLVTAGGVLVALMRAGRAEADPDEQANHAFEQEAQERRLGFADFFTLNMTTIVAIGALAAASLLAYIPFYLSFKAFYTQIQPLVDGGMGFMRRTTLFEFLMFWAIFVFIALSYLIFGLWRFPWRQALQDFTGMFANRTRSISHAEPAAPLAFEREPMRPAMGTSLALAAAGSAGASGSLPVGPANPTNLVPFRANDDGPIARPTDDHTAENRTGQHGTATETSALFDAEHAPPPQPEGGDQPAGHGPEHEGEPPTTAPTRYAQDASGTERAGYLYEDQSYVAEEWPGYDPEVYWAISPDGEQRNWVAEAHAQAQMRTETIAPPGEWLYPGVLPLAAGLGMLVATGLLVLLQLATGQYLLALLIALIGGITATTLSTTRSASALGMALLLVVGLAVALGVELVYLADHLNNSPMYRMNTVFKFYIQVWVLLAAGGAVAVYYILHGLLDNIGKPDKPTPEAVQVIDQRIEEEDGDRFGTHMADTVHIYEREREQGGWPEGNRPGPHMQSGTQVERVGEAGEVEDEALPRNWLVWSASSTASDEREADERAQEGHALGRDHLLQEPAGAELAERGASVHAGIRWTASRVVWIGAFGLLLAMSLVFTLLGIPARVADRFAPSPPVGTLHGLRFMQDAVYTTEVSPFPISLRFDYPAIQWLNHNIRGPVTLAELPMGYYREYGMRAASNTGLPMVVGGLHQEEQRYGWLVGDRRAEMMDFFTTPDVQRALTYINKYDIDYIYLGQLEQAQISMRGDGQGLAKFTQLAEAGALEKVFEIQGPAGLPGTTIYRVVRDVAIPAAGTPVDPSRPGLAITPLPTATPAPPPTPPVDDPALKALLAEVTADPANPEKRMRLVEWYRQNGYFADAARELEVLVRQNPADVALRHMLGDAYQAAGQPDRALKAWEDARDVDLTNPAGHNKVGLAYLERKRYDDAIREFQEAVKHDPSFVESWFHLGEAYEAKGERDRAREAYQKAVDNSTGPNPWADLARQRLNR
jgi:YYY domain-containing protein